MINYLQTTPSRPVLPLLDPLTLRVAPQKRVGFYISEAASTGCSRKAFENPAPPAPNTQSLAELLLGFFSHYAELRMDQAVSVATASHVPRPGSWTFERFCILDPLAPDDDLGRHLTPETVPILRREFARAASDLQHLGCLPKTLLLAGIGAGHVEYLTHH